MCPNLNLVRGGLVCIEAFHHGIQPEAAVAEDELARRELPPPVENVLLIRRSLQLLGENVAGFDVAVDSGERNLMAVVGGRPLVIGTRVPLFSSGLNWGFEIRSPVFHAVLQEAMASLMAFWTRLLWRPLVSSRNSSYNASSTSSLWVMRSEGCWGVLASNTQ